MVLVRWSLLAGLVGPVLVVTGRRIHRGPIEGAQFLIQRGLAWFSGVDGDRGADKPGNEPRVQEFDDGWEFVENRVSDECQPQRAASRVAPGPGSRIPLYRSRVLPHPALLQGPGPCRHRCPRTAAATRRWVPMGEAAGSQTTMMRSGWPTAKALAKCMASAPRRAWRRASCPACRSMAAVSSTGRTATQYCSQSCSAVSKSSSLRSWLRPAAASAARTLG